MKNNGSYLSEIKQWMEAILQSKRDYFLIDVKTSKGNQIKVFVDADNGASVDALAGMNKALRRKIEESSLFPAGNFSLEISSPGLDEPLKQLRQYKKNIGRDVEAVLFDGLKKKGKLKEVNENGILLEYKLKPKKEKTKKEKSPEKKTERLSFDKIKTTKVCVGF